MSTFFDRRPAVLAYLASLTEEADGLAIQDAAGGRLRGAYAALARLQRDGLVAARWDNAEGMPRRMFSLTDAGRDIATRMTT